MDKAAARAAHDLMLRRIEASLKEEDRSNALMWRARGDAESARAMIECSQLADVQIRVQGSPIDYGELKFPSFKRT